MSGFGPRFCVECNTVFIPDGPRRLCCSKKCKKIRRRRQYRETDKRLGETRRERHAQCQREQYAKRGRYWAQHKAYREKNREKIRRRGRVHYARLRTAYLAMLQILTGENHANL